VVTKRRARIDDVTSDARSLDQSGTAEGFQMVRDVARRTSDQPGNGRGVHRLGEQTQYLGAGRPDQTAERGIVAMSLRD
jgi:hypothetical protein